MSEGDRYPSSTTSGIVNGWTAMPSLTTSVSSTDSWASYTATASIPIESTQPVMPGNKTTPYPVVQPATSVASVVSASTLYGLVALFVGVLGFVIV